MRGHTNAVQSVAFDKTGNMMGECVPVLYRLAMAFIIT